jgi:uncharacterized protein YigE (DUF2233 family)
MIRLVLLMLMPTMAHAACRDMTFDNLPFTVCDVAATEDVRLFAQGPAGNLGSFTAVNDLLATKGKTLGFAMNAGMYHRDRSPVGLFVADGVQTAPLVTRDGPGNFGLLPNGVFCVGDAFAVIESRAFADTDRACTYATQSGPMLVINGELHPNFIADSPSTYIRNGVGVTADGQTAIFAISDVAVNFHTFGRLFRDALHIPNALYFDGSISRLYAPDLNRHDAGLPMGPIIGTVVDQG